MENSDYEKERREDLLNEYMDEQREQAFYDWLSDCSLEDLQKDYLEETGQYDAFMQWAKSIYQIEKTMDYKH